MGKIWIFGGNGFVGRHLTEKLLSREYEVCVCDIVQDKLFIYENGAAYSFVDIRDIEQISALPIGENDICINLAANQYHTKVPRRGRREFFFETNSKGVENILTVMQKKNCSKFIQFTTDMTYGKPQYLPVDTSHPQNPFGYYGQSKKEAEQICFKFRQKGIHITIFRPRMIMGPGRLGIMVKLFKLMNLGLPVPMIGSGSNHYQMISVFDCVSATILAMEKGVPNSEYNLGSINPPSIRELLKNTIRESCSKSFVLPTWGIAVKLVLSLFAKAGTEIMYKEQYMIADQEYLLDISKTQKELNWNPQFNDQDMVIQSFKEYNQR